MLTYHNGLFESFIFQTTSPSYPGYPWVSLGRGGPTELDFKGSGCDLESLGMLEAKNLKNTDKFDQKMPVFNEFSALAPLKPHGRTKNL